MKTKNTLILIIILALFSSCMTEYSEVKEETNSEYHGFDLKTIKLERISVSLKFSKQTPASGILIKFWTASPLDGGEVVLKGITDEDGFFITNYNLPLSIDHLILETNYIGIANYLVLSRVDLSTGIEIIGQESSYERLANHLIPNHNVRENHQKGASGGRVLTTNYEMLGTYSNAGRPNELEPRPYGEYNNSVLLSFVNASFPTSFVSFSHPHYLSEEAQRSLVVTETADVFMTFFGENTENLNSIGFYTYATGNEPQSVADIETVYIAFPNASSPGSDGGGLFAGDQVKLGRFDAGTTIGFVLLADAWDELSDGVSTSISAGIEKFYSNNDLNPESTPETQSHAVLLWDDTHELFLLGFEDQSGEGGTYTDFNDALFYITADPRGAISTENVNLVDQPTDTDGDGVNDVYDEFPTDATLAYKYTYPGENTYGTFAFEDQWPGKGDYDFNDLVVDYQYEQYASSGNNLQQLKAKFVIKAVGATYSNGFGFQMDDTYNFQIKQISGQAIIGEQYSFNANGTEAGQLRAVIIASDNVHQGFQGSGFVNTNENLAYQTPDTILVTIDLQIRQNMSTIHPPFNPFIVVNKERGREVHMSGYPPTSLVDSTFFGQSNDRTNLEEGVYYTTSDGLPWSMNLPMSFAYPLERNDIREGYTHFNDWASSGGFTHADWYEDELNFRSNDKIYTR